MTDNQPPRTRGSKADKPEKALAVRLARLRSCLERQDDAAFAAILQKYRIAWALVRTGSAETKHLTHLGWTPIHTDPVASVFLKH